MRWERDLLAFLRRELAPSSMRWRAAARTTLASAIAIGLVMALQVPEGEFLLVTLFVLTPADAGASLEKARLRSLGTLGGGLIGLALLPIVADKPWLFLPLHALVIAVTMFFARTTTAPYAFVLGAVTFVMVLPLYPTDPAADVATALWRTALTTLGVLIATGSQLLFWPDDPEVLLLDDLAARAGASERLLARLAALAPGTRLAPVEEGVAVTGLTQQLDLLRNAETRSRWLRQRHAEQVALIVTVQRMTTAARRLGRIAAEHPLPDWTGLRLGQVRAGVAAARAALAARRPLPPAGGPAPSADPPAPATDLAVEVGAAVEELERALAEMPRATAFLAQGATTTAAAPAPIREPLAEQRILTPACTLANVEAVRFALKVALATSLCGIVLSATELPGLSTSLITCAVIAQSFLGAGLRKAVLRLAGALAGGALTLLVLVGFMPVLDTLASYLLVVSATFGVAAWVAAGSSRIGYVGLQMAIVLALTLVESHGPTTDLAPPANRLAGVLLGVLVMGVIDVTLWPVFGERALRRALADVLRQIAGLHRAAAAGDAAARRQAALGVYRALGEVLAMQDDLDFEPGAGERAAMHAALLRVVAGVERLFLDLLALGRHRPPAVRAEDRDALARLDADTAEAVADLGRRLLAGAGAAPARLDARRSPPGPPVFAHLYGVAFDALDALAGAIAALERAVAPVTAPAPARRPRTPAPQPS